MGRVVLERGIRMKNFINNIKVKLIVAFAVFLIIPTNTVGYLSNSTARDAVEHEILDGIEQSVSLLNSSINSTIEPKKIDIDYYSQIIDAKLYQDEDSPELREKFSEYSKIHPEALAIYLGTESGIYVQEPRVTDTENYDPRERDWYQEAIENKGETIISEPYADAGTNEMVITVSKSTEDGNGVVAVDLLLTHIQELINHVKIGEEGYALLLDINKKYITHPTEEAGTEASEEFYNELYKKEQGTFTYSLDHEDKLMSFMIQ